ncbi:MAG: hypothetical protein JWQ98_3199 [Chlorobi bacterium]|nr:hypothetical protein [Chlorobiota bacterium]
MIESVNHYISELYSSSTISPALPLPATWRERSNLPAFTITSRTGSLGSDSGGMKGHDALKYPRHSASAVLSPIGAHRLQGYRFLHGCEDDSLRWSLRGKGNIVTTTGALLRSLKSNRCPESSSAFVFPAPSGRTGCSTATSSMISSSIGAHHLLIHEEWFAPTELGKKEPIVAATGALLWSLKRDRGIADR